MARSITISGNKPTPNFPIWGKKTDRETLPGSSSIRLNVPTSRVGVPIPFVLGRRRISEPNVLWYGNPNAIYETETETVVEVRTVLVGSGPVYNYLDEITETTITTQHVVGYNIDIMMGVCLGPDVHLRAIYHNNKVIWEGDIGPNRDVITLEAGEDTPFNGTQMIFHGGAFDQTTDPVMADVDDMPGYVGLSYVIFRNMRADIDLGAVAFEVERFTNPLGLSSNNNRRDNDINLMTVVHQLITSDWGGAGVDASYLNIPSLVSAGNTLASEGNFCAFILETEASALGILGQIQAQAYAIIFQNPSNSLLTVNLIRYSRSLELDEVRQFGTSNVRELRDFKKNSWADTFAVLRGIFVDRANDYEPTPVLLQNRSNALQQMNGRSSLIDYPYITKARICLEVLSRTLAVYSSPTFGCSIVANRDAAELLPGDIVFLNWIEYKIYSIPMVVQRVRKLTRDQNTVIVALTQYKMPEMSPIVDVPGDGFNPDVVLGPVPPSTVKFLTAPFWLAEKRGLVSVAGTENVIAPLVMPVPANNIQSSFDAWLMNAPGAAQPSKLIERGVHPTYGSLVTAIDRYDGFTTGSLSAVVIDSVVNPGNLRNIGVNGIRAGTLLVSINNEIFSFESCTEVAPRRWQLNNVRRALIDTVPATHAPGSGVYIINNNYSNMPPNVFGYPASFTPQWRVTGNTINQDGSRNDGLATSGWSPSSPRTMATPRPHNSRIDGVRSATRLTLVAGETYPVQWNTRTRNSDTIRFQTDAAQTPETFVTSANAYNITQYHRVMLRDSANTLHVLGETPTDGTAANSLSVEIPEIAAAGPGSIFVRSVSPFGVSVFDDELPVTIWKGSDFTIRYRLDE